MEVLVNVALCAYFVMVMECKNQKDNTMRIKCTLTSTRKIKCRLHSEKVLKKFNFSHGSPRIWRQ